MEVNGLIEGTFRAASRPLSTAAAMVGRVRGLAAVLMRAAAGGGPAQAEWTPPPEPLPEVALDADPVPQREPAPPGESFATEPTASTRASAHEGIRHGTPGDDPAVDAWDLEADDLDLDTLPGGIRETLERYDDGPVDPGELKAVRKEAEILRKAADVEKE